MVDFSNVINEINKLSGVKSIARKFDSSERIWVRVKSSSGATTSTIYCYNLSGTKIAQSGTITTAKGNHDQFFAMDDKCWIYTNTANAPMYVYQISGSSIVYKYSTNNIGSWPGSMGFAWKQDNDIHFSTTTNGSRETPIDCNITTKTVVRTENSSQRVFAQYFHYTGAGFEGVFWNHSTASTTMYHTRYKLETTASGSKDMTSASVLADGYYCVFMPTFYYTNNHVDVPYELFAMTYNPSTSNTESDKWTNLGVCDDARILRGTIEIPNTSSSFQISKWGLLHDGNNYYSYNASTGKIDLINTVGNKIATKQEARNISGIGSYGSEGNKAILRSEINSFGLRAVQGASYIPDQCVKLSDLTRMSNETIIVTRSYTYTESGGRLDFQCRDGNSYISSTTGLIIIVGFYDNETCSGSPIERKNVTLSASNGYYDNISTLSSEAKIEGYYTKIITLATGSNGHPVDYPAEVFYCTPKTKGHVYLTFTWTTWPAYYNGTSTGIKVTIGGKTTNFTDATPFPMHITGLNIGSYAVSLSNSMTNASIASFSVTASASGESFTFKIN